MKRILIAVLLVFLLPAAALAQEPSADLLSGYKLGKFHATAALLAADLVYVDAITQQLAIDQITDENYASGAISDDDVLSAQMGLAYTIWRVQFMIVPSCEAGLEEDAFTHPALTGYKEDTQQLLSELLQLSNEFLADESEDFASLLAFHQALVEGGYADSLFALAEDAQLTVGDES